MLTPWVNIMHMALKVNAVPRSFGVDHRSTVPLRTCFDRPGELKKVRKSIGNGCGPLFLVAGHVLRSGGGRQLRLKCSNALVHDPLEIVLDPEFDHAGLW